MLDRLIIIFVVMGIATHLPTPALAGDSSTTNSRPIMLDCGANTLFVMAQINTIPLSYDQALQRVPVREHGNSVREMRDALTSLGLTVEAVRISPDEFVNLRVPAVILALPQSDGPEATSTTSQTGHYFVIRPLSNGEVQILDFPREPRVLSTENWAEYSQVQGTTRKIPVLLCGKANQTLEQMLGKKDGDSSSNPSVVAERINTAQTFPLEPAKATTTAIKLEPGTRRSPILTYIFDDVAEGSTVQHEFVLENTTQDVVTIAKFEQSCACTALTASSMRIEPGGRTTLTMSASLTGRFTTTRVDAAVYFKASDQRPPVLLVMQGRSHGRFTFVPPVIERGQLRMTDGVSRHRVVVRPTEFAGSQRVSKVVSKSPHLVAAAVGIDASGTTETAFDVTFDPASVSGRFVGQVAAYVGDEKSPAAVFELRAQVESLVSANPSSLLVTEKPNGQGATSVQLIIEHRDRKSMRLKEVNVVTEAFDAGEVSVVESTRLSSQGLALDVRIKGSSPFTRQIVLQIDVEGERRPYQITVPFVYAPQ